MIQVISVAGALLILGAYGALQTGRLDARRVPFSALNALGSGVLTFVAIVESQAGFLLLEGAWCVISCVGMVRALLPQRQPAAG